MKIKPPAIKQNDVTTSVGGRDGAIERGGEMYNKMYVATLATPA